MRGALLLVDDEKVIRDAFKRVFINLEYTCFLAANAAEALDILKKDKIDIIIADLSLPGMDGHCLLNEVKIQYPDIIRVMISGYSDPDHSGRALGNGTAMAYITKPWKFKELSQQLDFLLKQRNQFQSGENR